MVLPARRPVNGAVRRNAMDSRQDKPRINAGKLFLTESLVVRGNEGKQRRAC